jgi:hypothetical protein
MSTQISLSMNDTPIILSTIPMTCLAITVSLLNIFVLVVILSSHKLRHSIPNRLIASLACADLCIGAFVLPLAVVKEHYSVGDLLGHAHPFPLPIQDTGWPLGKLLCDTWLAVDVCLCTASIYNLLAISFDRFMAVLWPIHYKLITRHRLSAPLLILPWIVAGVIAAFPFVKVRVRLFLLYFYENISQNC